MGQNVFWRWSKYPNVECNSWSQTSVNRVHQILLKHFSHHNEDKACFPRCFIYIYNFVSFQPLRLSGYSACMGTSYYADRVSMWTLEIWGLHVHVWSPLKEAAQLSIYMGVCVCIYIYI